ncbi:NAD-dependent epimerase/dehydratase family protein [Sphingobacterium multivorum]
MKDIAILGSSGFIGQNLLENIEGSFGVSLRNDDLQERLGSAEVIVNLVGKAHDHKGDATEEDYFYVNFELTKQIFTAFNNSKASVLIHVSSIAAVEEYESAHPLVETDSCKPSSWYGKSKLVAEQWLFEQERNEGKKIIIVRPPMVHGIGDKGSLGLLYNLIAKGIPYPLSSFRNSRSFIGIDNFIFFINEIVDKGDSIESGIYHIADDEYVSTSDIIAIIKEITGKRILNLSIPRPLVRFVASLGDRIPIPLNTKRLKKMTGTLLLSNIKAKSALGIKKLPTTAKEALYKTIRSFR